MNTRNKLYTAKEAAIALGKPKIARTLTRRAVEAYAASQDDNIQRLGGRWAAPLSWWISGPLGRKRKLEAR